MKTLFEDNLFSRKSKAAALLRAIEDKEIDPQIAITRNPHLIAQALEKWGGIVHEDAQVHLDKLSLIQKLETLGANIWSGWNGANVLGLAYATHNAPLLSWVARHPKAPCGLIDAFFKSQGGSPLFGSDAAMIDALFQIGASADIQDSQGNTPLHLAINARQVSALLAGGMNGDALNHDGRDARDYWDDRKISSAARRSMEQALGEKFPIQPEKMFRRFGEHLSKLGITKTKRRIKETGIHPAQANWNGFGLVELYVAHVLDHLLDDNGAIKQSKKKVDRTLSELSACKSWIGKNGGLANLSTSIVAAEDLFNANAPSKAVSLFGARNIQGAKITAPRLECAYLLLEKMATHGLVKDGSYIAANLMRAHIQDLTHEEWMTLDASGMQRFEHLLMLSTRGLWDRQWLRGAVDYSPLSRLPFDIDLMRLAMDRPQGLGTVILAKTRTKTNAVDALSTLIASYPVEKGLHNFELSESDPGLVCAIEEIRGFTHNMAFLDLAKEIESEMRRQDLSRQTSAAGLETQSRRL